MLKAIDEDIWEAIGGMYLPGRLVHFSLRMTVIRLADGSLLLHSPIEIDDELAGSLADLGQVRHILAPNKLHHLFLAGAIARYPEASAYGAPGLAKKRRDIAFSDQLTDTAPAAWRDELDQVVMAGVPAVHEVVFFHRKSRSLIVTDLIFNIHQTKGLLTGILLRLVGAFRKPGQSRAWRLFTKDRSAAAQCLEVILGFDCRRVLMAHGDVLEGDLRPKLEKALAWMRSGSRK